MKLLKLLKLLTKCILFFFIILQLSKTIKLLKDAVFFNNLLVFETFKTIKTMKLLKNTGFFNNLIVLKVSKTIKLLKKLYFLII